MSGKNQISVDEYFSKVLKKPIKHKYHAKPTEIDGERFPSKLEASYYRSLKKLVDAKEIAFFLRQVPFHLPANVKYLLDFMIFWESGDITCVDVKGMDTPISKLKRKQVEELYPIKIDLVTKV